MRLSQLQIFFFAISMAVLPGTLPAAPVYAVEMGDVDQHKLSTADGHVTIIVLARSTEVDRVRAVGDRVPDSCIGNPTQRFITLLTFEQKHAKPARLLMNMLARRRLDAEAKRLQPRYTAKKLTGEPRHDVFAVLDFDGTIAAQLEVAPTVTFQVLVLGRSGELLARWNDVPSADELAVALR